MSVDNSKPFLLFDESPEESTARVNGIAQTCIVSKENAIKDRKKAFKVRNEIQGSTSEETDSEKFLEEFKEVNFAIPCAHPRALAEPYCWMPIETLPEPESLSDTFVLVSTWVDSEVFSVSPAVYGGSWFQKLRNKPPRLINPYTRRILRFTPQWWCRPVPPPYV